MPTTPVTTQQSDPYVEFGGSIATAPAPASTPSPSPASSASSASSDPYAEFGGKTTPEVTSVAPTASTGDSVAKHGLLSRAWDWVNQPIFDSVLPTGVKTADIVKAAAFEKMYGEAYIPGVNDFETKATAHLGENPTKHAVRTFINGAAADTANMASSFTSPVGIATTVAGVGPEAKVGTALAKVAPVAKVLAGTAFGLQGAHQIYQAGTENTPEAWEARLQGAAQITGGAALAGEPLVEPVTAAASKVIPKVRGAAEAVENIAKGGQPKLQAAIRDAAQAGADIAEARTAAEPSGTVHIPDEYKAIVADALKQEPAWTPEKAAPVVKALGKDFEVRGSVAEGKSTSNDLDIWQKNGELSDAAEALKRQGFKFNAETPHGQTWTRGDQHIDLWDSEHEPIKDYGKDTELEASGSEPTPAEKLTGVRTVLEDVSKDVKAKSQGLYKQLDTATNGRWQRFEDQIRNLEDKMAEVNGVDDDEYDRLETKRNDIETSQAQAIEDLKGKGIDPKIADDAIAYYKQAMSIRDVDKAVKGSTTGDLRVDKSETVNPKMLTLRLQRLYDSGRLQQALGSDGADAFLKEAYAAKTAKSLQTVGKWAAGAIAAKYGSPWLLHQIISAITLAP